MRKFGLSLEKDGGYSKVIVVCSALLSGFTFGLAGFQGVLTAQVSYINMIRVTWAPTKFHNF